MGTGSQNYGMCQWQGLLVTLPYTGGRTSIIDSDSIYLP